MGPGELGPASPGRNGGESAVSARSHRAREPESGWVIETVVSPFHCLYQDALELHTQSRLRLAHSEAESSRLARAAVLLYLGAAEALVHQAAAEMARPELAAIACDPNRPLPVADLWALLPALVSEGPLGPFRPDSPPWPQFLELLQLRMSWLHPGPASTRRAYYRTAPHDPSSYEPLQSHQIPAGLNVAASQFTFPRTGLPRDPYALRPSHLDTVRAVLDSAIAALDQRLDGALTRDGRHRKEPIRVVYPPPSGNGV